MTLQNRVLPTGEIVADPARGLFTGNRGILHRPDGSLGRPRWRHKHWLCCALRFKDRYHGPMPERGWTALFFLDEAVALAAGHRPCHECRRADALRFRSAWEAAQGPVARLADIDIALHPARVCRNRKQTRFKARAETLPDGCFVLAPEPALVLGDVIISFSTSGYGAKRIRPSGIVTVLTPATIVRTLAAGYRPVLHPTAFRSAI
ncbi:hypothetical protein TG4357_02686 [Thalassovita gelatinovora]|uniref:Uncharacterized protein n=1 Tax=Thalassovita gelatinovora TaxID=53501 RepID=A0A0P1FFG3_THAGE|nr:hypothetical protein [Thalassovita gelatinovora]QIZ79811.1 hypothetical protein HFZ77_04600 [Thalassovita gelatinovora]CUH66868.1 hypothetical protein TG4357_02686 [Thalassovita gelatinovora]SEQ44171.1 hypothetical protein SAMN04488043_105223 [Thalassovita gelatinovora]